MILANNKIIIKSNCIRFLRRELEQIAHDYTRDFEIIPFEFIKVKKNRPCGVFMLASNNKITVYKKIKYSGILYNTFIIDKLQTFRLIEPVKQSVTYDYPLEFTGESKRVYFKDVHIELINKLGEQKE